MIFSVLLFIIFLGPFQYHGQLCFQAHNTISLYVLGQINVSGALLKS